MTKENENSTAAWINACDFANVGDCIWLTHTHTQTKEIRVTLYVWKSVIILSNKLTHWGNINVEYIVFEMSSKEAAS